MDQAKKIICLLLVCINSYSFDIVKKNISLLKITAGTLVAGATAYGTYRYFTQTQQPQNMLNPSKTDDVIIITFDDEPGIETSSYATQLAAIKTKIILNGFKNYRTTEGETPLTLAALCRDAESIQSFLQLGATINEKNSCKETPLIIAALTGCLPLAKKLIDWQADVNAQDIFGFTPIMHAIQQKRYSIAQLLIQAHANLELTNAYHMNARMMANQVNDEKMLRILENKEPVL